MYVALSNLNQSFIIGLGPLTAFDVLGVVPILFLATLVQRHIIKGMTLGAVPE